MNLIKKIIKNLFFKMGFSITRIVKPCNAEYFSLTKFLSYYLERHGSFTLIQIGANDGITFDPIREFIIENKGNVKGVLIEPMNDAYQQLVLNYKDFPNIFFENLAIHNEKKEMILYKVAPDKIKMLKKWSGGVASFDPQHHKRSGTPSEYIIQEKVKCATLDEIVLKYDLKTIDLLQIDTEGYDTEIIKGIDFMKIKPAILRFEHGYMDGIMNDSKIQEIFSLLNANGYQIIVESYDATAYLPVKFI